MRDRSLLHPRQNKKSLITPKKVTLTIRQGLSQGLLPRQEHLQSPIDPHLLLPRPQINHQLLLALRLPLRQRLDYQRMLQRHQ